MEDLSEPERPASPAPRRAVIVAAIAVILLAAAAAVVYAARPVRMVGPVAAVASPVTTGGTDSGVAACMDLYGPSGIPAGLTRGDYLAYDARFRASRYPDLRSAGTAAMDAMLNAAEPSPEVSAAVAAFDGLFRACSARGVRVLAGGTAPDPGCVSVVAFARGFSLTLMRDQQNPAALAVAAAEAVTALSTARLLALDQQVKTDINVATTDFTELRRELSAGAYPSVELRNRAGNDMLRLIRDCAAVTGG